MARVKFTPNLVRFFPDLRECEVEATTIAEAVRAIDQHWRGLGNYIVDEQSSYVTGANIFSDGGMTSQLINRERYASKALAGKTSSD